MNNPADWPGDERRKYKRVEKNFVLNYHVLDDPEKKHDITQLKNISMGGMCFVTTGPIKAATRLGIHLKTPYISETTYVEAVVLQSHEKVKNTIYDTRVKFDLLNTQAQYVLSKLVEFFLTGEQKDNE